MTRKIIAMSLLAFAFAACNRVDESVVSIETSEGTITVRLYEDTPLHRENFVKLVKEGYYEGTLFHRVINHFMIQGGDPDSRNAAPGALLGEGGPGYDVAAEFRPGRFHKKGALAAAREGDEVNPERRSSGSQFYLVQGNVFTPESLDKMVARVNEYRRMAVYERLKSHYAAAIDSLQSIGDQTGLAALSERLTARCDSLFQTERLTLSPEQREAYATVGGTPHLDGQYTVFGEITEGMDVLERIAAVATDENDRPLRDVVVKRMTFGRK